MFKIRLLILSLISILLFGCANSNQSSSYTKLSVDYISGEYDGLLLSNTLKSYLNGFKMFDKNSNYQIQANISHSSNLFITNIDNTSDREKITSNVNINIYDKKEDCITYTLNNNVSQFYILTSSDKFISNKRAFEAIKIENTEYLVKKFINNLTKDSFACN
tara:strand:+ start:782 stop:1267 length:486 start_codon:yes stop_codon:yes gene_type:complete